MHRQSIKTILLFSLLFILGDALYAQDANLSFFSDLTGKKRTQGIPVRISSDSMDINVDKNIAIFTGNVFVDDQDVKINCHKMIIKLKPDPNNKNKKVIDTITCLGDVIVKRKLYDEKEKSQGEQRVEAGKALWQVDKAVIVLTEKPVLRRGEDNLRGREIVIYLNSNKMDVKGGGRIEFRQEGGLTNKDEDEE